MKKILLIENDEQIHIELQAEVNSLQKKNVVLHPAHIGDDELNYNYNGYLIGHILEDDDNFEKIINHYQAVDLFVVDVSLSGNTNTRGLDFCRYIIKKCHHNFHIIIISHNQQRSDVLDDKRVRFISKFDTGRRNFIQELLLTAGEILSIELTNNIKPNSVTDLLKPELRTAFVLHRWWSYFRANLDRTVDKSIFLLFYILIFGATVHAGYSIIKDMFIHSTDLLTTAEHIFLALLPIYIILGFFKYYRNNLRINFFGAINTPVDDEASTKTMSVTKLLFTSSIISYTIIRTLEQVFEKEPDITKLLSCVILLITLMAYYLLLDRKKAH